MIVGWNWVWSRIKNHHNYKAYLYKPLSKHKTVSDSILWWHSFKKIALTNLFSQSQIQTCMVHTMIRIDYIVCSRKGGFLLKLSSTIDLSIQKKAISATLKWHSSFSSPFFFNAGTNIAVLGRHALPIFWLFYSPSHPFKPSSHLNPSVPALIKSIASDLSICFMTCVKILNQFSSLCEQVSILKSLLSHTVLANYPEGWHPVHSAACKAFLTFLNYYDIGKFKL